MNQRIARFATLIGLGFAAASTTALAQSADDPARTTDVAMAAAASSLPPGAESAYVAQIHAMLDRGKRYPTGREASLAQPRGTTRVWFVLSRDGRVESVGTEQPSGSQLLDAMARSLVRRASYPAFPTHGWDDAGTRRFTVGYSFDDRDATVDPTLVTRSASR